MSSSHIKWTPSQRIYFISIFLDSVDDNKVDSSQLKGTNADPPTKESSKTPALATSAAVVPPDPLVLTESEITHNSVKLSWTDTGSRYMLQMLKTNNKK